MTRREATAGMTRPERRHAEKTHKLAQRTLQEVGNDRGAAVRLLHDAATESLSRAMNALQRHGDRDRCREWIDHALRRLHAAYQIEAGR